MPKKHLLCRHAFHHIHRSFSTVPHGSHLVLFYWLCPPPFCAHYYCTRLLSIQYRMRIAAYFTMKFSLGKIKRQKSQLAMKNTIGTITVFCACHSSMNLTHITEVRGSQCQTFYANFFLLSKHFMRIFLSDRENV